MRVFEDAELATTNLNVLAYGEPGCGKTHFVGSVGEVAYTLGVDVDLGFKTMLKLPKQWRNNIVKVFLEDFDDLNNIYQLCEQNDPERWTKELFPDPEDTRKILKPFEAVAIDTWSEMNWAIKQEKRRAIKKLGDGNLRFRANLELQDWQQIIDLNQMSITAFRSLPISFICTMHEAFMQDDKSGQIKGVPAINGKFAAEVGKFFDIVGHMHTDMGGNYIMSLKSHQRYQAKSRLDLPKELKNATYKTLVDAIKIN